MKCEQWQCHWICSAPKLQANLLIFKTIYVFRRRKKTMWYNGKCSKSSASTKTMVMEELKLRNSQMHNNYPCIQIWSWKLHLSHCFKFASVIARCDGAWDLHSTWVFQIIFTNSLTVWSLNAKHCLRIW